MKVISTNCSVNLTGKNLPSYSGSFQSLNRDKYANSATVKAPCFGHNPMQTAQEVLKNPGLRDKFISFLKEMFVAPKKVGESHIKEYAEYAVMAALTVFGVAVANNTETAEANTADSDVDNKMSMQDLFKMIFAQPQEPEAIDTELPPKEIEEKKTDETNVPQETATEPIPVEETEPEQEETAEKPKENNSEAVQEQDSREYLPVEFPKKWGKLSNVQKALKDFVADVRLPKEEGEKLTYLCKIAITKEFKTPGGDTIQGEAFAKKFIEYLKSTDNILDLVNKVYAKATKEEPVSDAPNEEQTPGEGLETERPDEKASAAKDGNSLTSLGGIRQNPLQLTIVGKVDTEGIDSKTHSFSDSREGSNANQVPSTDSSAMRPEDTAAVYSARPKNTEADARIRFLFSTPPVARDNNIFAPPVFDQEGRLNWVDAGGLAMLLSIFKNFLSKDSDNFTNLSNYARKLYINSEKITDKDEIEYIQATAVRPRWATNNDSLTINEITEKRQITFDDLNDELQRKYYKHIEKLLSQECQGGTARRKANVINDILAMLNDKENQEYFQYFTIHSAMRFIERYLITLKDPRSQCKKALPALFNMLKEQLAGSGVDVTSYFGPRIMLHNDKDGEEFLTVVCNPNIVIYPKSDLERKLFGSNGIIIGLAEYKSPEGYKYFRMEPIIKTIESESPNNIYDSLK